MDNKSLHFEVIGPIDADETVGGGAGDRMTHIGQA